MSPAEFAAAMREAGEKYDEDWEVRHVEGDALMLRLLRDLGYGDGCDVFIDWDRWYA